MQYSTHNIFYILNVYTQIVKVMEDSGITYSDWPYLKETLSDNIQQSSKTITYDSAGNQIRLQPDVSPDTNITYKALGIQKLNPFSENDYFIKNPYTIGSELYNKRQLELSDQLVLCNK